MDIVFEGPDNTGKSTVIHSLSSRLPDWIIQRSEGPEKYVGEIDERIGRYYLRDRKAIYDRHPAVSETIYGPLLRGSAGPTVPSIQLFYSRNPLIVYCRPPDGRGMIGHVVHEGVDTEDHLSGVDKHYDELCRRYDMWALHRAHLVYRIGDDVDRLIRLITRSVRR